MSVDKRPSAIYGEALAKAMIGKVTEIKTQGIVPDFKATIVDAEAPHGVLLLTLDTDVEPFDPPMQFHLTAL